MQEIDPLRAEIDQIHDQMRALFQKRLALTRQIWEIKKNQNLPLTDVAREEKIIHRFDPVIQNTEERKAVQNFFKSLLFESRKYLEGQLK